MQDRQPTRRSPSKALIALAALGLLGVGRALADEAPGPAPAVLKGRVTDEAGRPLADARVWASVPAADMRLVASADKNHAFREARADAEGFYRLELPGLAGKVEVSVDASKPYHRRLSGTLMMGGDDRRVEVEPGREAEANVALPAGRYFRGVVVDEAGRPVSGVEVGAYLAMSFFGQGTAGVEVTSTAPDGSFELFNYLVGVESIALMGKKVVHLSHPDFVPVTVDVGSTDSHEHESLRVVLPTGRRLAGTVVDDAGRPVGGALVEVDRDQDGPEEHGFESVYLRKATSTAPDGSFSLRGVADGPATFHARKREIRQKSSMPMAVAADRLDLAIRLQPLGLPADLKTHKVLGMTLADTTPALKSAYDLYHDRGALVLDPGPNPARLEIGDLAEGDNLWLVGDTHVKTVRQLVDQLLAEVGDNPRPDAEVCVVYTFRRVDFEGSSTQHIKLTRDDIQELKALSKTLADDARRPDRPEPGK